MATSNGNWQNRARIEWYYSVGALSGGKRTVSVTAYLRMDQYGSIGGTWPKSWSGAWGSGSSSQSINLSGGQRVEVRSGSASVTVGASEQTVSFSMSVSHFHGTTSHTLSVKVPAGAPDAPSGLQVARASDTRQNLSWTRNATYTSIRVERRTNGGAWTHVATINSNAASWSDTSTRAGNEYQYRVRGARSGLNSGWSNTVTIRTSPGVPSGVTATRVGDEIRVSGTVPSLASHLDIQDGDETVVSALPKGSLPWTHATPNQAVPHRYRMRARVASGGTGSVTLYSGWSVYSETVQLTAPPAAPTGLSPNGGVWRADQRVTLKWLHSPVDSSEQTTARWRYRKSGTTTWSTIYSGVSAIQSAGQYTLTQSLMNAMTAAGPDIEWQVATRGAHPGYGAWSAVASFTIVTVPEVGIISPEPGGWLSGTLPVSWAFFQAEGRPQSAWRAVLLQNGAEVEVRTGAGATSQVVFRHHLENTAVYEVEVSAATGTIWSPVETVEVVASFVLPAPGAVEGGWNDVAGAMDLLVLTPEQEERDERVNLAPNPSAELGVALFTTEAGVATLARSSNEFGVAAGSYSFYVKGASSGISLTNAAVRIAARAEPGESGHTRIDLRDDTTHIGLAFSVRAPVQYALAVQLVCYWYDEAGFYLGATSSVTGTHAIGSTRNNLTTNRYEHAFVPLGGAASGVPIIRFRGGDLVSPASAGFEAYFDALHVSTGGSILEALAQVEVYFDGSSGFVNIGGVLMAARWEGVPHESASVLSMPERSARMSVERSVDDGVTWETVIEPQITGEIRIPDYESLSNGVTKYRVTTFAPTGAQAVREFDFTADSDAIWLNSGEALAISARLPFNPQISVSASIEKTLKRYSGRSKPVLYSGTHTSYVVDTNGVILVNDPENAQVQSMDQLARMPGVSMYRDPDGRRIHGMLSGVTLTRQAHSIWGYAFQLEETER